MAKQHGATSGSRSSSPRFTCVVGKIAGCFGDRQRIAILAIVEQELAFVIGAPQLDHQRHAGDLHASPSTGVHSRMVGNTEVIVKPPPRDVVISAGQPAYRKSTTPSIPRRRLRSWPPRH